MTYIQWAQQSNNWHIGATMKSENEVANWHEDYVIHHAGASVVSVRFCGKDKDSDDYGPMVLVHSGHRSSRWLRNASVLYLVVAKGTDAVAAAQYLCQWHNDHGQRWPDENVDVTMLSDMPSASVPLHGGQRISWNPVGVAS